MGPDGLEEPLPPSASERAEGGGPATVLPAALWRRALALVLDLLVVWLLLRVSGWVSEPMARLDLVARAFRYACGIVIPVAYFVLGHGTGGRTLGKRLTGARVVDAEGVPIGYLHAVGRLAAQCLSAVPLGLGFLIAGFRRDRRTLHDLLAGTRVIGTESL